MAESEGLIKVSIPELEQQAKALFRPLYEGAQTRVAATVFSDELKRIFTTARRARQMIGGLEAIAAQLQREEKGLAALRASQPGQRKSRITRILFFTSDGSERFLKMTESILKKYDNRVLGVRLDALGSEIGKQYFGPEAEVKAILLKHKLAVEAFLRLVVPDAKGAVVKNAKTAVKPPKKK